MNEINDQIDSLIYEVGYHLVPTVDESEVLVHVSKIKSAIEEKGGVVISEEMPKLLNLAYEISKSVNTKKQRFNRAYFGWVKFEIDPSQISKIKNKIESMPEILRFLIIKTVKENTLHTPKIPMFKKENNKEEKGEDHTEKPKASEADIDKSIDELVVGQTL
jgi:ribosomal protein S6